MQIRSIVGHQRSKGHELQGVGLFYADSKRKMAKMYSPPFLSILQNVTNTVLYSYFSDQSQDVQEPVKS